MRAPVSSTNSLPSFNIVPRMSGGKKVSPLAMCVLYLVMSLNLRMFGLIVSEWQVPIKSMNNGS